MLIQLILLPLLLFQFSFAAPHSYGKFCDATTSCDQHQMCINSICRCHTGQRRFWTGEKCIICAKDYTFTNDRCYKFFDQLQPWQAARAHCRSQYADLFTWRDNHDEQFIRPAIQGWVTLPFHAVFWSQIMQNKKAEHYLAWAGATITTSRPRTTNWVDSTGMKLNMDSDEWCNPLTHYGYQHQKKEPTSENRKGSNGTEHEECLTYNFGGKGSSLLCLADDYCSQKYPFICEMNAASMKLATATSHGDDGGPLSETAVNITIDFEEPPPPPPEPELKPDDFKDINNALSAHGKDSGLLTTTNIAIFAGVGIVLIIGAIAGYMLIQKKKAGRAGNDGDASQDRPSFASSVGSIMD